MADSVLPSAMNRFSWPRCCLLYREGRSPQSATEKALLDVVCGCRQLALSSLIQHWAAHNISTDPNRPIVDAESLGIIGTLRILYNP